MGHRKMLTSSEHHAAIDPGCFYRACSLRSVTDHTAHATLRALQSGFSHPFTSQKIRPSRGVGVGGLQNSRSDRLSRAAGNLCVWEASDAFPSTLPSKPSGHFNMEAAT